PEAHPEEKPAPFKIGALNLPMVTYEGDYNAGIERLATLLVDHYGAELFPVVSVGLGPTFGFGALGSIDGVWLLIGPCPSRRRVI
ncbi:unnamed protein product, partial [Durusdinium trenchii]